MKSGPQESEALFLGLDASTQGLKAVIVDGELRIVYKQAVHFDRDLPEFKTEGGAHRHADGKTVTSPPLMWTAALDLLLERAQADKAPLGRVAAVSGSGQQHGSVWLRAGAREALRRLDPARPLREQLAAVFALEASPIWMDASTTEQCRDLEDAMGGAQALAELTGSRAYERFTGNQIAKIRRNEPEKYADTERIALVSSFMASLLAGEYAPIDVSDGSGMNLMDVRARDWSDAALDHTGPGLREKLGAVVPSHTVVGPVHRYYCEKFGFGRDCLVLAFSGDNPNSLAGLRLQKPGDIAISLGTSDTLFGSVSEAVPSASEGHVFASPVDPAGYMVMIVRQNGSLTRERVRDRCAGEDWAVFSRMLRETPAGNGGRIGFYVDEPEITPPLHRTGLFRFDENGRSVDSFRPAAEVRAVVEGQFLALRLHGENVGLKPAGILATGGASRNEEIVRVVADVFGVTVCVGEQPDSAALGAAYRALHGWTCARAGRLVPFSDVLADAPPFRRAAEPDPAAHRVYSDLLPAYADLERRLLSDSLA